MSFAGKALLAFGAGALIALTAYLWINFGGAVYAAYLAGALMACF